MRSFPTNDFIRRMSQAVVRAGRHGYDLGLLVGCGTTIATMPSVQMVGIWAMKPMMTIGWR